MTGWQEPKDGNRLYIVTDNSPMNDLFLHVQDKDKDILDISYGETCVNLGMHYFKGKLYSANYVGICRLSTVFGNGVKDSEGNELLIKVIPRFGSGIIELLNYIREDDEFDRYLAPQTRSTSQQEKDIEAVDKNEIFYFFEREKPIKVEDSISSENSIITITVFLSLLQSLCKKPLMGRMIKKEDNLTGKIKGKIVIEKNLRSNTMRGRNDRFYCSYLHYSDDILENQILKAALNKSRRFVSQYFGAYVKDNNSYSRMIAFCSNALRHISDVSCTGQDCVGLRFSGCYTSYNPLISMAQMVLNNISIESTGIVSASGYVVPYAISMDKLFEVYVRTYLKKNGVKSYKEKSTVGIQIAKFDEKTDVLVEDDTLENPGKYIAGPIKPDIILTNLETQQKAVFDVKYKNYQKGDARNDRLQLLAYCMMLNANNIGIIMPATDTEVIFDCRTVNSTEQRLIRYHQLLLGMSHADSQIADYIKTQSFSEMEE